MDLSGMQQIALGTILVPVLMGLFKNELIGFFKDLAVYRNRAFDDDGDPGTGQDCHVQSGATGEYNRVTVKEYKFGLLPASRQVVTLQRSPVAADEVIVVPYSYSQWANMVKGSLSKQRKDL